MGKPLIINQEEEFDYESALNKISHIVREKYDIYKVSPCRFCTSSNNTVLGCDLCEKYKKYIAYIEEHPITEDDIKLNKFLGNLKHVIDNIVLY